MRDQTGGHVPLQVVYDLLSRNEYTAERRPQRSETHERFLKEGGAAVVIVSHRGMLTPTEFARIKALVAKSATSF